MLSGIEPSPDKMLQARLFSYSDTHRHRLGNIFSVSFFYPKELSISDISLKLTLIIEDSFFIFF